MLEFTSVFFYLCADMEIGRIGPSSLSDQTLIEILSDGFKNQQKFRGKNDEYRDLKDIGSHVIQLNGNEQVIKMNLSMDILGGTLAMRWLPPALERINMQLNELHGDFDSSCFPASLVYANFADNFLTGTADMSRLPRVLQLLKINNNKISGTLDFSNLPESIMALVVSHNAFTGRIDLTSVSKKLTYDVQGKIGSDISHERDLTCWKNILGLSFCETEMHGDVLVKDIRQVEAGMIFSHTNCRRIVDESGRAKQIY